MFVMLQIRHKPLFIAYLYHAQLCYALQIIDYRSNSSFGTGYGPNLEQNGNKHRLRE